VLVLALVLLELTVLVLLLVLLVSTKVVESYVVWAIAPCIRPSMTKKIAVIFFTLVSLLLLLLTSACIAARIDKSIDSTGPIIYNRDKMIMEIQ
jgi:hypothetical protein